MASDSRSSASAGGGPRDDARLLAALRAGDAAAFEELVREQSPRLLATLRRIVRHEEDAREALQDAFVSAFRALAGFEGQAGLSTWLHRIAVNAGLMKLRAKRRRPESALEELLPKFGAEGHALEPPAPWQENAVELSARRELRAIVRELVDELPDNYRTVLVLRDLEELATEEVAQMLGITSNAVKIRVHRARQALRTLLDRRLARSRTP